MDKKVTLKIIIIKPIVYILIKKLIISLITIVNPKKNHVYI